MLILSVLLVNALIQLGSSEVLVYVDSLTDNFSTAPRGHCNSTSLWPSLNGTCNLRSAIMFCDLLPPNNECNIEIQANCEIQMKPEPIAIFSTSNKTINLIGNNAKIMGEFRHTASFIRAAALVGSYLHMNFSYTNSFLNACLFFYLIIIHVFI